MINVEQLNLPAIVRHYMLANTPAYLYRNLRAEPSVESFAASSTPEELLRAVGAYEEKPNRTSADIAIAYAMLVALSFQNYEDVQRSVVQWKPRILTWAQHIFLIIAQRAIANNIIAFTVPSGRIAGGLETNETPTTFLTFLELP
jgi:glutamate/tyrosine decarboxylase-like PLP-dependent enzyme